MKFFAIFAIIFVVFAALAAAAPQYDGYGSIQDEEEIGADDYFMDGGVIEFDPA